MSSDAPLELADGTLRWEATGAPRGHIGLLHGVTSSASTWSSVAPLVAAAGYTCTAVDLPGHGQGPRPGPVSSISEVAALTLPSLPSHLDVLVGHSLGAVVAAVLAAEHPALADAVVLVEPAGTEGLDPELFVAGIQMRCQAARQAPEETRRHLRQEQPGWDDELVDRSVAAWQAADSDAIAGSVAQGLLSWDLAGLVGRAEVPVMVVAAPDSGTSFLLGGSSALIGQSRSALVEVLPPERFVVVAGAHSLQRDQPAEVAGHIVGFARSLGLA